MRLFHLLPLHLLLVQGTSTKSSPEGKAAGRTALAVEGGKSWLGRSPSAWPWVLSLTYLDALAILMCLEAFLYG